MNLGDSNTRAKRVVTMTMAISLTCELKEIKAKLKKFDKKQSDQIIIINN